MLPLSLGSVAGATVSGTDTAQNRALDPRLKSAAHEFEASLMKEFLKPMLKDPLFSGGTNGQGADGSNATLMSFGAEALAKAISERGGFGIANTIIAHFEKQAKSTDAGGANSKHLLRRCPNR